MISSVISLLGDSINNHKDNTWCASRGRSSAMLRCHLSARASCLATLSSSNALGATCHRRACPLTGTTPSPCQSSTRTCRLTSGNDLPNPQSALVDGPSSRLGFVLEAAAPRAYEGATFDNLERTRKATVTNKRGVERVVRKLAERIVSKQPCIANGGGPGTLE